MSRYLWISLLAAWLVWTQISCSGPKPTENSPNAESAVEEGVEKVTSEAADSSKPEGISAEQLEALKKDLQGKEADKKPVEVPELLKKASTLPAEKTPEKLVEFLNLLETNEENIEQVKAAMEAVQTMPQEQAMELFMQLRNAQLQGADLLLAHEDATAEQLKRALTMKVMALLNTNPEPKAELEKLRENFEKRGMEELVWNIDLFLMISGLPRTAPNQEQVDQFFTDATAFLERAKGKDWLKMDFLGIFMEMILSSEETATPEKVATFTNLLATLAGESSDEKIQKVKGQIEGIARRIDLVGKPMELVAQTLDGQKVDLKDYAGKVVLVDFWATWCGPCVQSIPGLQTAYENYNKKGFEILGFSLDEDQDALKKFMEEKKLPWTIAVKADGEGAVDPSEAYGVMAIPMMILVGKDGNVLKTNLRGEGALEEELEKLFPLTEEEKAAIPTVELPEIAGNSEETGALPAPAETPAVPAETPAETPVEVVPAPAPAPAAETPAETPAEAPAETPAVEASGETPSESTSGTEVGEAEKGEESDVLMRLTTYPQDPTVENLVQFIKAVDEEGLRLSEALRKLSPEEQQKQIRQIMLSHSRAADGIVASEKATKEQLELAVMTKAGTIVPLSENDPAKIQATFDALVAALKARGAADVAWQTEVYRLVAQLQTLTQMPDTPTMNGLLESVARLSREAKTLKCMDHPTMQVLLRFIMLADGVGDAAKISQACGALHEALITSDDANLVQSATLLTGMARRLTLKGNPMEMVGVTLDGKEVSLADYRGKVVLVDFWATWCGPCVREFPHMKKMYEKYQEKGFEILGFSLDEDKEKLAGFLKDREVPWTVLVQKENGEGIADPAGYYGVLGIPCMILVGADGKVVTTHARGEALEKALEKLFP